MLAATAEHDPQKWASLGLAALVHVALAVLLFFGVSWRNPPPAAVEVELVRAAPEPTPAAAPPQPAPKVQPPPPPPKPQPVALPKPDIALKDRDKPKPKPVPVELPDKPTRAERERTQRLMEERQSDALAREMQQIENKKLNQQLERELARSQADRAAASKAQEEARAAQKAAAAEAQAAAMRGRLIATYQDKIRGKIRGNIVMPPDMRGNPVVRFDVTQLPSGEIIDVVMTTSSGNRTWDESVERAIRKSSPLPRPETAEVHQRILHLTFCPDEERGCR